MIGIQGDAKGMELSRENVERIEVLLGRRRGCRRRMVRRGRGSMDSLLFPLPPCSLNSAFLKSAEF